jgi:hypothetical protein
MVVGAQGLFVLADTGVVYLRIADKNRVNEPNGPHWTWVPVAGPVA